MFVSNDRGRWVEQNLPESLHGFGSGPVTLKLTDELHPGHWFCAGLDDALERRPVCLDGGSADSINHRVDLVATAHRIKRGEREASLRPQCGHDELFAARRLDRMDELAVFPGVNRRAVQWLDPG